MNKFIILLLLLATFSMSAQDKKDIPPEEKEILQKAVIKINEEDIIITISKVNVTNFPEIKIYFTGY